MGISTHVLDLARGRPAAGIAVTLEAEVGGAWRTIGSGTTDADGRVKTLVGPGATLERGTHRITFALESYFAGRGVEAFYPSATITFVVKAPDEHHHVPLLLSPFGYSTYRGS